MGEMEEIDRWRASRRSFLGWTAALGAALLTRPALAVSRLSADHWPSESEFVPTWVGSPYVIVTHADGSETRVPMRKHKDGWVSTVALQRAGRIASIESVFPAPVHVKPIWLHLPESTFR